MYIAFCLLFYTVLPVQASRQNECNIVTDNLLHLEDSYWLSNLLKEATLTADNTQLAAALVQSDGQIILASASSSDRPRPDPIQSHFQLASLSKVVSAALFIELAKQNIFQSTGPFINNFGALNQLSEGPKFSQLSLTQILSHTAGLSVGGYAGFLPPYKTQTLQESLESARDAQNQKLDLIGEPGQAWRYSGGGYSLLQYAAETITKKSFNSLADKFILSPLKMNNTSFVHLPSPSPPLIEERDNQEKFVPRAFTASAAAGLESNLIDTARFTAALLDFDCTGSGEKKVLGGALAHSMLMAQPNSNNDLLFSGSLFGQGLALYEITKSNGFAYHTGDNMPHWHNLLIVSPSKKSGLIILSNSINGRSQRLLIACAWLQRLNLAMPTECF